jgi:hypothetical protein
MGRFFSWEALVALVLILASACGGNATVTPIQPGDYNQTCTTSGDCMLIESGNVCGCQGCPGGAAINKADQGRYQSDYDRARSSCPPSHVECPALCVFAVPICNAGTCGVCTDSSACGLNATTDAGRD